MTASWRGGYGVEGLSKREKGLMDVVNCVVIAGMRGYKGLNGNAKNTIKIEISRSSEDIL